MLRLVKHLEHRIPRVERGRCSHPEWDKRFQPSSLRDSANVDGTCPSELFQNLDNLAFCLKIISADQHFSALVTRVDHSRIRDCVEALYNLRLRKLPLNLLTERII